MQLFNKKSETPNIDILARNLELAKEAEAEAKLKRIEAEIALLDVVGAKMDGQTSMKTSLYKVTTKGVMGYKIDAAEYDKVQDLIPEKLRPVKFKPELDKKQYRYLEQNEPEYFRVMASCVEAKPGKTQVSIQRLEQE